MNETIFYLSLDFPSFRTIRPEKVVIKLKVELNVMATLICKLRRVDAYLVDRWERWLNLGIRVTVGEVLELEPCGSVRNLVVQLVAEVDAGSAISILETEVVATCATQIVVVDTMQGTIGN